MFGRKSKDELWEARLDDLKREHQRTVEALTAWIEQLQLQVGAPALAPVEAGQPPNMAMYVGDEEGDLYTAHAEGVISDEQLSEGLQQLGFLNKEVVGT